MGPTADPALDHLRRVRDGKQERGQYATRRNLEAEGDTEEVHDAQEEHRKADVELKANRAAQAVLRKGAGRSVCSYTVDGGAPRI